MIYLFLILAAMAIVFVKFGALSVWFTVLSGALIGVAVIVAAILVAVASYAIWKLSGARHDRLKARPKL